MQLLFGTTYLPLGPRRAPFAARPNLNHLLERNASIALAIRMPMLRIIKVPASAEYISRLIRSAS